MGVLRILAVAVLLGGDSPTGLHAQECCTGQRWTGCQSSVDCGSDVNTGRKTRGSGFGGSTPFCGWAWEYHYLCATNCVCTPCSSNQYETSPPKEFEDRVCTSYRNCNQGTYISVQGTSNADRQCQTCPSGQFTNISNLDTCSCEVVNYEYLWGGWSDDGCGKEQSRVEAETCNAPSGCTCTNKRSIKTEKRAVVPCTTVTTTAARAQECCTGLRLWTDCISRSAKRCGANQVYTGKWNQPPKSQIPPDAIDNCRKYECATNCVCTPCSSNQYESSPPEQLKDRVCTSYRKCSAGSYISVQGTPTADRQCQPCPYGQFTSSPNLDTCSQHAVCGQGEFISSDVLPDADRRCLQCPDEQYQQSSGHQLTTCTAQITCEPGEKFMDGGKTEASSCAPCDSDTFQSMGSHRDTCFEQPRCAKGEYLLGADLGREGYCSDCPKGQYAEGVSHRDANCTLQPFCEANEYLAGGDATAEGTCTACPEGTVQPSENHQKSRCDHIVSDTKNMADDDASGEGEAEGIESNDSNGEGESNGGGGNPAQTTTVDPDAQAPPLDLQPTKSTNGAAIAVPLVLILLIGLGAGYWVYYRRKKKRHPPGQGQAAEIIEMIENPMPAAAAARAASFGSAPAVHAAAVQAGDVIYVPDNGASGGLAGEQDEGVAMATYSVPHANRDPSYSRYEAPGPSGGGSNGITYATPIEDDDGQYENVEDYPAPDTNRDPSYSGYEAPGTKGGSSNSTTYATPMEDDGAGRVPNPMYQSADGNGRELARVPNPMYQSADGTFSTTNISSA